VTKKTGTLVSFLLFLNKRICIHMDARKRKRG
jgi:hypothetical protein